MYEQKDLPIAGNSYVVKYVGHVSKDRQNSKALIWQSGNH